MYNHQEIEKKWQNFWEQNQTFATKNEFDKPKYYVLDMFPYPSGAGLHVGHPKGYTANDIIARYKHANGYNVLHPMGWDAFGLPAENFAIKTGTHPSITTAQNIATFKSQIKALGFSYDWNREIDTTDPKYYQWTQWIFAKMFEAGLAYEQDLPINFCPHCKTGVANEEVLNNGTHERCEKPVVKKKLRQWVLAITKYADRLEKDVDDLDWPEGIKDMQKKWIGRSEGCEFEMKKSDDASKKLSVYTTRIDTVFGMTYVVMAPDHANVSHFITAEQKEICEKYIQETKNKSDLDRTGTKEKTGVFTGSYVINPFNGEKIAVYIGDYVLGNYGTGAVMAVPAHDERDFEFAKKMGIEIKKVIFSKEEKENYEKINDSEDSLTYILNLINNLEKPNTEDGVILLNDLVELGGGEFLNFANKGEILDSKVARERFTQFAEKKGFGTKKVNYKLRDWLFSRQRYWGEPIPLIHLEAQDIAQLPTTPCDQAWVKDGNILMIGNKEFSKIYDGLYTKIVVDYRLPLELPEVEKYEPSPDGNSPLANVESFVNVELAPNLKGKRETNTMPQWGGSCWYYLRFMDAKNPNELVQKDVEAYWGSVDSYVGGTEHAVLHLLYARFWHKFLYDIGVVSTKEPFARLRNQGLILAYSYQNKNGGLVPNDEVEEKDGEFFDKNTNEKLSQVVAKMSKSLKNVVNPDDIVKEYGADALRMYEMYMSDFKDSAPWDTKNIVGITRFLDKVFYAFQNGKVAQNDEESLKTLHKSIKKISEDIENYKFNTAIANLMILINMGHPKDETQAQIWKESFALLLHPFAPHAAEELWSILGKTTSIYEASWPKFDENLIKDESIVIGIQVLGKLRGELEINVNEDKETILHRAKQVESVQKWIEGKNIVKEIYVPGKIVNLVVQ